LRELEFREEFEELGGGPALGRRRQGCRWKVGETGQEQLPFVLHLREGRAQLRNSAFKLVHPVHPCGAGCQLHIAELLSLRRGHERRERGIALALSLQERRLAIAVAQGRRDEAEAVLRELAVDVVHGRVVE